MLFVDPSELSPNETVLEVRAYAPFPNDGGDVPYDFAKSGVLSPSVACGRGVFTIGSPFLLSLSSSNGFFFSYGRPGGFGPCTPFI
jgi:hypothetical protein